MRFVVVAVAVAAFLALAWKGVPFGSYTRSDLEAAVDRSYRVDYTRGQGLEPKHVHCHLSGFEPELVERSQSLNAEAPFHDCTVSFSDGTRMTSCWSGAKDAYRIVWIPREPDGATSQSGCGALLMSPVTTDWATTPGSLSYG